MLLLTVWYLGLLEGGDIPSLASAFLSLFLPLGPGQGLQPSWVSLMSPWQVGKGCQVPSTVQTESMLGPVGQENLHSWPRNPEEQ